jgi:PTH1 family peptidyl-tRNA hydrolase
MKLIVGLGNPGEKYVSTRHNLGFLVVEHFLKDFSSSSEITWDDEKKFKSLVATLDWQPKQGNSQKVLLLKPQTFMNVSGVAVRAVTDYYHIEPEDIWVIHDELDSPLGSLKIRTGGSSAGHKGVSSIMDHLGTEKFWRFRMGIGNSRAPERADGEKVQALGSTKIHDVEEYVVGDFSSKEVSDVKKMVKHTVDALICALEKDLHSAQNQFNTK